MGEGIEVSLFIHNLTDFVVVRFHTTFLFATYCKINLFIFDSNKWETQERVHLTEIYGFTLAEPP